MKNYVVRRKPDRRSTWSFQLYEKQILKRVRKYKEFDVLIKCDFDSPTEVHFKIPYTYLKKVLPRAKKDLRGRWLFEINKRTFKINWHNKVYMEGFQFLKRESTKTLDYFKKKIKSISHIDDMSDDLSDEILTPRKRKQIMNIYSRNQKIVKKLKKGYGSKCQICGYTFKKKDGGYYSEGHHLIPLGERGYDSEKNIVILCPTCHKKMHYAKQVKLFERRNNYIPIIINGKKLKIKFHTRRKTKRA